MHERTDLDALRSSNKRSVQGLKSNAHEPESYRRKESFRIDRSLRIVPAKTVGGLIDLSCHFGVWVYSVVDHLDYR